MPTAPTAPPVLALLVDVAATYRLTKLVLDDEVLAEVRDAVLARYPPATTKLGYLLTCPWCVSVWAALAVMGLRRTAHAGPLAAASEIIAGALAASAATGLAYERL